MSDDGLRSLRLPDLGLGDQPVVLSMWLAKRGARIAEGDPVVEVMADGVTIDLPSPVDGILVEKHAGDGDILVPGQRLATIEESDLP